MDRLAGRSIFSLGEHVFRWEDVVLAAYLWREFPALERRVREALACETRLQEVGSPVSEDDVEAAASDWRYERNLISADDTESWLSARSLSVDEWLAYVRRAHARKRCEGAVVSIVKKHRPSPDDLASVIFADAMCSGFVTDVTERLAGRVAIHARATSEGSASGKAPKAKLQAAVQRLPIAIRQRGLFELGRTECVKRAESIAMMDVVFDRFIARTTDTKALGEEIGSHGLDWTRLDCQTLLFATEEPAREAALLMREDHLPIAKAAKIAHSKAVPRQYVLEDTDPPLRDRLVVAQPGDLVGPVRLKDGFLVAAVRDRIEPSAGDQTIRDRARVRIAQRIVQGEVDERIRWHERF